MSTTITGLSGFDQSIYDDLKTKYTQSTGKTEQDLQAALLAAAGNTGSFSDAVKTVSSSLPTLSTPIMEADIRSYGTLPSFGSNYLALITQMASEQRQQTRDMRAQETEAMAQKIEAEADTIRSKAVANLITGIVSGTLTIAQGLASGVIMAKGISKNSGLEGQARQVADGALNNKVQNFNSIAGGANNILNSIGQTVATQYDAKLKEQEADVERMRAMQTQLDSLDEALKEVIRKAISSQEAIQQNVNQTRTKILG